jgi:hypothetical protein
MLNQSLCRSSQVANLRRWAYISGHSAEVQYGLHTHPIHADRARGEF